MNLFCRTRTIKNSCGEVPTNLVLFYCKESAEMVIEVVIHTEYRDITLGRYLMEETEAYCKRFL